MGSIEVLKYFGKFFEHFNSVDFKPHFKMEESSPTIKHSCSLQPELVHFVPLSEEVSHLFKGLQTLQRFLAFPFSRVNVS